MDTEIDWNDVIKKEARGMDDLDLGEVQEVVEDKVVVQKGIIDHNIFHLPKSLIKSYDGQVLRFNISEGELKNYEVESSYTFGYGNNIYPQRTLIVEVAAVEEYKLKTILQIETMILNPNHDKP